MPHSRRPSPGAPNNGDSETPLSSTLPDPTSSDRRLLPTPQEQNPSQPPPLVHSQSTKSVSTPIKETILRRSDSGGFALHRGHSKDKKKHLFGRFGKKKHFPNRPDANARLGQSSAALPNMLEPSSGVSSSASSITGSRKKSRDWEHRFALHPLDIGVWDDPRHYANYLGGSSTVSDERKKSSGSNSSRKVREKSDGSISYLGNSMELDQNFGSMDDIVNRHYQDSPGYRTPSKNKSTDSADWAPPESWGVQLEDRKDKVMPNTMVDEDHSDSDALSIVEHEHWDIRRRDFCIRVFRPDKTFSTLYVPLNITTRDLGARLAGKFFLNDMTKYSLEVHRREKKRALLPDEQPVQILKQLFEQMGYTDQDKIEDIGREDNSYLMRFAFGPTNAVTFLEDHTEFSDFANIDMHARNLSTVPIFLFKYAKSFKSIDFSENLMMELPTDFIRDCTALKKLLLTRNEYPILPRSLHEMKGLEELDISCNRLRDFKKSGLENLVNLRQLRACNNCFDSIPDYFASFKNLTELNLSNNLFTEFPDAVCDVTTLKCLDISFNRIHVFPEKIGNLTNLVKLYAIANTLRGDLPSSFTKLTELRVVDIRHNLITNIDSLSLLPKLDTVAADYNAISNVCIEFKFLRRLSMDKNHLTQFNAGYCLRNVDFTTLNLPSTNVCALTELNLAGCKLSSLPEDLFLSMPLLEILLLDDNTLSSIPISICVLRKLLHLSIQDNNLTSLPREISKLVELKSLEVQKNNLQRLPKEIWLCAALQTLNCSSNLLESFPEPYTMSGTGIFMSARGTDQIGAVESGDAISAGQGTVPIAPRYEFDNPDAAFNPPLPVRLETENSRLETARAQPPPNFNPPSFFANPKNHPPPLSLSLQHLLLGDNRFTDDVWSPLSLFLELRTLNLSFNDLYEIPSEGLCHMHIYELYLSGNHLTSLPADDIEKLSYLRVLVVSGNKLQTLPAEIGKLRKLLVLDVGNNVLKYNISNWPYDWNWNWNLSLKYLNLSGNKRLEIKKILPDVHNPGEKNLSDFKALTRLRMLGLMDITILGVTTPEEYHDRRVRTSPSDVNNMAYGVADWLGPSDHLMTWDSVTPRFRNNDEECIFAIFDGHWGNKSQIKNKLSMDSRHDTKGGCKLTKFLSDKLTSHLANELAKVKEDDNVVSALRRTFLVLEKELGLRTTDEYYAGSSCVVCFFFGTKLYVANVGDAMAVISRNNGEAFEITQRHIPLNRSETSRIHAAGGYVSRSGKLNNEVDVSRCFGYFHLIPAVNANPYISEVHLMENDEFLIMASRGLWDVMTYQTAIDVARTEKDDPMFAAQKLRDFAITYGAESNIMVMVIGVGDLFDKRDKRPKYMKGMSMGPGRGAMTPDPAGIFSEDIATMAVKNKRRIKEEGPGDSTLARLQREVAPPMDRVALVFTDIKSSTFLWEAQPEDMRSSIKIHDAVMRRTLRSVGGYEVKTEGDAFMVCFQNITAALLWCFTVQIQLLDADWPASILMTEEGREIEQDGVVVYRGLSVRMGIHWGAPVFERNPITNRMDYFGPVVNKASRICNAADGGQICVSSDVIDALRSIPGVFDDDGEADVTSPLAGTTENYSVGRDIQQLKRLGFHVMELGERRLKGLETPEMLSMVYPKRFLGRMESEKRELMTDPSYLLKPPDESSEVSGATSPLSKYIESRDISYAPTPEERELTPRTEHHTIDPAFVTALHSMVVRLERVTAGVVLPRSHVHRYGCIITPSGTIDLPTTLVAAPQTSFFDMMEHHMQYQSSDHELVILMDNFVTRIENVASALYLQKVGHFANVLEKLAEAVELDSGHIAKALQMYSQVSGLAYAPHRVKDGKD